MAVKSRKPTGVICVEPIPIDKGEGLISESGKALLICFEVSATVGALDFGKAGERLAICSASRGGGLEVPRGELGAFSPACRDCKIRILCACNSLRSWSICSCWKAS